jgi:hypothetical protein
MKVVNQGIGIKGEGRYRIIRSLPDKLSHRISIFTLNKRTKRNPAKTGHRRVSIERCRQGNSVRYVWYRVSYCTVTATEVFACIEPLEPVTVTV